MTSERWGEGTVQRYDGDQLTVLFDEHGYRDLLVPLVVERRLLRPPKRRTGLGRLAPAGDVFERLVQIVVDAPFLAGQIVRRSALLACFLLGALDVQVVFPGAEPLEPVAMPIVHLSSGCRAVNQMPQARLRSL